jgi:hypothetical protein
MIRSGASLKILALLVFAVVSAECFMIALLLFSNFTEGSILGRAVVFKALLLLVHWFPLIAGWRIIRQSASDIATPELVQKAITALLITTYATVGFVEIGLMLLLGHR